MLSREHYARLQHDRNPFLGKILNGPRIDVIGDRLTEINVTSPTGIREVKRFGGADIAALLWDAIEAKRKARRGN